MVLESLFHTRTLLENKFLLFGYTAFVTIISVTVSYVFFKESASILAIAFITFAFMYFLIKVYYYKEREVLSHESNFFKRYLFVVEIYVKIFVVVSIVFTLLYVFLPTEYRDVVFKEQVKTLQKIDVLRGSFNIEGNMYANSSTDLFLYIFLNNIKVLFAILLFSFLFGVGALFIIVYQASVFGTVVGTKILSLLPQYVGQGVYGQVLAIFHGSVLGLGLLPHGAFELLAYFLAAVVGGIVSAVLHGHYIEVRKNLVRLIWDLTIILSAAVFFLFIGALIESHLITG